MKDKTSDRQKLSDIEKEKVVVKTAINETVKQAAKLKTSEQLAIANPVVKEELKMAVENPENSMSAEEAAQVYNNLATNKKSGGKLTRQFTDALKFLMPQMVGAAAGALAGGGGRGALQGASLAGQAAKGYRDELREEKRLGFQQLNMMRLQKAEDFYDSRTKEAVSYDPQTGAHVKRKPDGTLEEVPVQFLSNRRDDRENRLKENQKRGLDLREDALRLSKFKFLDSQGKTDATIRAAFLDKVFKDKDWSAAKSTTTSVKKINAILQDAVSKGGQSLAMLGPEVARRLAGEVGVLTDLDVTRYVVDPSIAGQIRDGLARLSSGKISPQSAENLARLLNIAATEAADIMDQQEDLYANMYGGVGQRVGKTELKDVASGKAAERKDKELGVKPEKKENKTKVQYKRLNGKLYKVNLDTKTYEEVK